MQSIRLFIHCYPPKIIIKSMDYCAVMGAIGGLYFSPDKSRAANALFGAVVGAGYAYFAPITVPASICGFGYIYYKK